MTISAQIIADSVANNIRITTLELEYPRFIHAECKTHRLLSMDDENYDVVLKQSIDFMDDPMLSRNASSSRAIPVKKMLDQIKENPAMPIHWGINQPGMQADNEYSDRSVPESLWKSAAKDAVFWTKRFNDINIHKQVSNRLLDTFQHIKVIVTATEWDNFFTLRLDSAAQPEMRELARVMKEAMDNSVPRELGVGEWHLPYVEFKDFTDPIFGNEYLPIGKINNDLNGVLSTTQAIKCSAARCARVSYLTHDNSSPVIDSDIALADKLLNARHMSPMEHQATPMKHVAGYQDYEDGITHTDRYANRWSGNFRGWVQYRQTL